MNEWFCRYGELTGQTIEQCSFRVLRDDVVIGLLGASLAGRVQTLGGVQSGMQAMNVAVALSLWPGAD